MKSEPFSQRKTLNLYFVKTDPSNPNHHGALHTNTAPFVLTTSPAPGDQVEYVLSGSYETQFVFVSENDQQRIKRVGGQAELELFSHAPKQADFQSKKKKLRVLSHLGRSVMLGEDGTEDAFGHDVLADLWLEILNGGRWSYAPCSLEIEEKPEDPDRRDEWRARRSLQARWTPEQEWERVDTTSEENEYIERHRRERKREQRRERSQVLISGLSTSELLELAYQVAEIEPDHASWLLSALSCRRNKRKEDVSNSLQSRLAFVLTNHQISFQFEGERCIVTKPPTESQPESYVYAINV